MLWCTKYQIPGSGEDASLASPPPPVDMVTCTMTVADKNHICACCLWPSRARCLAERAALQSLAEQQAKTTYTHRLARGLAEPHLAGGPPGPRRFPPSCPSPPSRRAGSRKCNGGCGAAGQARGCRRCSCCPACPVFQQRLGRLGQAAQHRPAAHLSWCRRGCHGCWEYLGGSR